MPAHVILASNRLPVHVTTDNGILTVNRSIGGVATAMDAVFQKYHATWVGWMGLGRMLTDDELHSLDLPERLVPVQAETTLVDSYYNHFSNQVLWPSLHHFWPTRAPSTTDWDAMKEIARRFAVAIAGVAKPDSIIWVHDYHLMMLPKALREAGLQNKVGFFLHTPFAPPQHWRAVMHHKELLESLCEADLLGVHTQREVHAVWECTKALKKRKRLGLVQAFPIGIDYAAHHAQVAKPEVQRLTRIIRDKYPGKQIIFSVSRLDYTKGILTQLTTVEQFLHAVSNPECYIYKLVVAPSREGVKAYSELQDAIAQKATAINAQFARPGWRPIQYAYEYHSPEQLAAWYGVADVLLLTPVIDGMNLVAKEYVAVRSEPGVLVLSTGAGVAAQLQTALRVPPEDADAAAIVLAKACNMKDDERQARWHAMQENVRIEDVFWWAGSFIRTLRKQ